MLQAAARLRPGGTQRQAAAEIDSIGARLQKAYPDTNHNRRLMALPTRQFLVEHETDNI